MSCQSQRLSAIPVLTMADLSDSILSVAGFPATAVGIERTLLQGTARLPVPSCARKKWGVRVRPGELRFDLFINAVNQRPITSMITATYLALPGRNNPTAPIPVITKPENASRTFALLLR